MPNTMIRLRNLAATLVAFATCTCIVASASAQGSPYNFIGFGTPIPSRNPVSMALGGSATALEGTRTISEVNPADWTWLGRARFEPSMGFTYYSATQGSQQGSAHNVQFNGITFAAPIWNDYNAAVSLGYVPLTDASAEVNFQDTLATRTYQSKGGANMLFLGFAARPVKALAVGARLDLVLGNIRHQDLVEFKDPESQSGVFERDYYFHGVRPTLGLEFVGDSAGMPGLTIGASFSLSTSLRGARDEIVTPLSSTLDTTIEALGNGRYPSSITAGISYGFADRYRAIAEYSSQDFTQGFVYSPNETATDPMLAASYRIGFGIERRANPIGEFGTSYGLGRWALRLGMYLGQLPTQPLIGTVSSGTVSEMAITAGVGIPIGAESMLNFAVVGGQRTPQNLSVAPKETFLRLGASISLSERWFVPSRRDE